MPLDSPDLVRETAVRVPSLDALENMGIVPIPQAEVTAYMNRISRMYSRIGQACWQHTKLDSFELRTALMNLPISGNAHDASRAPDAIIALALDVERNVKGAEFTLAHFYTDPVLTVTYTYGRGRRNACIGIWDQGKVVKIAQRRSTDQALSAVAGGTGRSWIARLFGL